jgi:hypothetical protein
VFDNDSLLAMRLNMYELSEAEKYLVILSKISCTINRSTLTQSSQKKSTERNAQEYHTWLKEKWFAEMHSSLCMCKYILLNC